MYDDFNVRTFTLTADHLTLLRSANVRWEGVEAGAPAIDPKRPYGNSGVELDIAKKLGWELFADHDGFEHLSREQYELAGELHRQTLTALSIVLSLGTFEPGTYERPDAYGAEWKRTDG